MFRERHDDVPLGRGERAARVRRDGRAPCSARRSTRPAAAGVIFFNNVGYLGMCGHGTHRRGRGAGPPGPDRAGDAPAGDARRRRGHHARRRQPRGRSRMSRATARPSGVDGRRARACGPTPATSPGGATGSSSCKTTARRSTWRSVERLTDVTWRIRQALAAQGITGDDGAEIDHIELFGPPTVPGADSRNFVLCPGKAYDRSPCGTGTSAKLACLAADGKLAEGQVWRQESMIGSVFEGSVRIDGDRVVPRIRGSAYVNAEATLLVRSRRPVRPGDPAMSSSSRSRHVVVIGGGVIGTACAYYLSRSGWQVTIVEKGTVGGRLLAAATADWSAPATSCRWPSPGWSARRWRRCSRRTRRSRSSSALDPALWSWLIHFALRCNHRDMIDAGRGIQPLLESSLALYRRADRARGPGLRVGDGRACCSPTRRRTQMDAYAADRSAAERVVPLPGPATRRRRRGRARAGPQARAGRRLVLPRRRPPPARQAAPLVAEGPRSRGRVDPRALRIPRLPPRRTGRAVAADTEHEGLDRRRLRRGHRAHGRRMLNDQLGCKVPIQPGKGYSLTMPRPSICPTHPADLPRDPRRRHALPVGLPDRLDDGVRRLRHDDRPAAAAAPPRRRGSLPARARVRADRGDLVRLAAHDLGQPADHRPQPGPSTTS